ncbi:FG-GAP repeat protein [Engelhardtia mirabilis]|uniref:FG-GAP repeat protein n=1 Tax=Engelhardtia mirabilis TaxID=2528011 RepID=A0A518BDU3_9BACT|nr:hypothetical protein Pla133_02000 [Planctomycetes bacterium Pla133]QDU99462.1 hypothetical protein Pla86_02000 [Planctomycetes bacterium Pla86]
MSLHLSIIAPAAFALSVGSPLTSAGAQQAPCAMHAFASADMTPEDAFGSSVALQGGRALIAARGDDDAGESSGAAYAFAWTPDGWIQEAKLLPDDLDFEDRFGTSLALDGDTAIVTSLRDDDAGSKSGGAYVFDRAGGAWTQTAKLVPADLQAGDEFGTKVELDGTTAVIGAWHSDAMGADSGAAYVYQRAVDGSWVEVAKLVAPDGGPGDLFGWGLDIQGSTIAVSAVTSDANGSDSGAVYLFEEGPTGWEFRQKLAPASTVAGDRFGGDLALDDDTLLVGAHGKFASRGAAYAFRRDEGGLWHEVGQLFAADGHPGDNFGLGLDVEQGRAVIGAEYSDFAGSNSGSAYVFELSPSGWVETSHFAAPDLGPGDQLGYWVDMDANHVVVGSRTSDLFMFEGGAAYLFGLDGCSLYGAPGWIELSSGGQQTLGIDFGADRAGLVYLVLGSASGTAPGIAVGGVLLPLAPDAYLSFTATNPGSALLQSSLGFLDADGDATATFQLPAGSDPVLAGLTVHHAALAIDPSLAAIVDVTNAYRAELLP